MHAVAGPADARLSATAAYDAIAADYDAQVAGDGWMRQVLHELYSQAFRPGERVLDAGCGTGLDAIALARRGVHVVGVDGSAEMLAQLRVRVAATRTGGQVEVRQLAIQDLAQLGEERFDGLISAFASLNTLSDADLAVFSRAAASVVRPGGHAILHLLNPFSLWEWLGYVARRDWPSARTVGRRRTRQFMIGGQSITHTLYFADEAYRRFFARDFKRHAALGLGVVRPPHTVRRVPPTAGRVLEWLDVRSGRLPLVRNGGRFWVLDLERRSS